MLSKNGKYKFYQRDEFNSNFYSKPLIKRNKEYNKIFSNLEIRIRNRSTNNKIKPNDIFSLSHIFVCLNKCKKDCKLENYKSRKIPSSIEGLNCDKVDDYLFSSQRLTNKLIKQYNLINKLNELNVGLIVNCQEKGEHPYCGTVYNDGLDESGFAYSTKELEKNGIHVLECGWVDFIAPESFVNMIKIVKTMYYYIHTLNKKVLVHCHAGMGRTGMSLACFKIFEKKINAENARKEIRVGTRKNCLGPGKQFFYCQEFEKYLEISRENFFEKNKKDITIFKINEKTLDVGNYKFTYFNDENYSDYVPIFLLYIFDRIIQIKNEKKLEEKILNNSLSDKEIKKEEEKIIEDLIKEINNYNWEAIKKCQDIKILSKLLFKWLNNSINFVFNPKIISLIDKSNYSLSFEAFKDSTRKLLLFFKKLFYLLYDNKDENNNLKDFLNIFIPSLLGYAEKELNDKNKQENIDKLNGMFEYLIKKK